MLQTVTVFAQQSMNHSSMAMMPIMATSNESKKEQLASAKAEGKAVSEELSWLVQQGGSVSGQLRAGEYKITYFISRPEGWYRLNNQQLIWLEPSANAKAHLWVFVQDGADERIVPPLTISYKIQNGQGNVTDEGPLPYAWMPLLNGYGQNIALSGDGAYTLKLEILPMPYRRHDPYNGDRFTQNTIAESSFSLNASTLGAKPLSETMEQHAAVSKLPGQAYSNTLKMMYKQANDGRDTTIGDYTVAYAVEYAEGYWHYEGDKFRYMQENDMSGKTNAHLEIAVLDAATGRFMHNLDITSTIKKEDGTSLGTMAEPFMWHPWLYHYGENWRIPKGDRYAVVANIQPPAYRRYGRTAGQKFSKPLQVTFSNVVLKAGQK